ncbi:hypothetical protein Tco_1023835 [Tanacetum coccineum]
MMAIDGVEPEIKRLLFKIKKTYYLVEKKQSYSTKNHKKPVKKSVRYVNTAMRHYHTERPRAGNTARSYTGPVNAVRGKPLMDDKGFVDSGCSRHMTGNIAYLSDFKGIFDRSYKHLGEEHIVVEFLLLDETQILLKIPRKDNMYSFDMKNIVPKESLTCLVAKATLDESML